MTQCAQCKADVLELGRSCVVCKYLFCSELCKNIHYKRLHAKEDVAVQQTGLGGLASGLKDSGFKDAMKYEQSSRFQEAFLMLETRRRTMKEYLTLKMVEEDWHGVQDAASDLRDIDAAVAALKGIKNEF